MARTKLISILVALSAIAGLGYLVVIRVLEQDHQDQLHYERGETELRVANLSRAGLILFQAGADLSGTRAIPLFDGKSMWLVPGNYFLRADNGGRTSYIPIPLTGYRCGPDDGGAFVVTLRSPPGEFPPLLNADLPDFVFIPGGSSLLGDRLNPREPHYVWLTGFFMAPFEVTNGEFRQFIRAKDGYANDSNWTEAGRKWKATNASHSSALLTANAEDYDRFGLDDQPITWVAWYEANAFCRWLTKRIGDKRWLYTLPNEAEWEKAARGPDNFDYGLGMTISDPEIPLYNWKKNPDAPITVVGIHDTRARYSSNRFGVYHMSGNVVEWTQSINRPYSRENPFVDDERNHDDADGLRVARGGSWYSASIAYLYIPYRDAFQPEHSSQDMGFRICAKALP